MHMRKIIAAVFGVAAVGGAGWFARMHLAKADAPLAATAAAAPASVAPAAVAPEQWKGPGYDIGFDHIGQVMQDRFVIYDPATDKTETGPVNPPFEGLYNSTGFFHGVLAAGGYDRGMTSQRVELFLPGAKSIRGTLTLRRESINLLTLRSGQVLAWGGVQSARDPRILSNAVERITGEGERLGVERLADIPGAVRRGMAMVELADNRVMVLGGSVSEEGGCNGCTAETWILDLGSGQWSKGPAMLQARVEASAGLLADGRVIVSGGWTPAATPELEWANGPSASVEVWDVRGNTFRAGPNMPSGLAGHHSFLEFGQNSMQLVVAGWGNHQIHALDPRTFIWRTVAETCSIQNGFSIIPYTAGGKPMIYAGDERLVPRFEPVPLHSSERDKCSFTTAQPSPEYRRGVLRDFERREPALSDVAAAGAARLIVAGGWLGDEAHVSGAVDMVDASGALTALPALYEPRIGGSVFTIGKNLALVGGRRLADKYDDKLPIEWMGNWQAPGSRWLPVEEVRFPGDTRFFTGRSEGGAGFIVALHADGSMDRVRITDGGGELEFLRQPLPKPALQHGPETGEPTQLRVLADGSIVFAGGSVRVMQSELVAEAGEAPGELMEASGEEEGGEVEGGETEDGDGEEAEDYETNAGWNQYEILVPGAREWMPSARSEHRGGLFAILNDGRVLRLYEADDAGEGVPAEMSDAAGRNWTSLTLKLPKGMKLTRYTRLVVNGGDLFLAAETARGEDTESVLLRLDPRTLAAGAAWEVAWKALYGWENHSQDVLLLDVHGQKRMFWLE